MNPKLSIVVVSRNDNHGGDLNHRTQIFINGISSQVLRTQILTELIFVEWNPPADRPPLFEAYDWPKSNPFLKVRVITVPNETHRNFKCHPGLPLIQMEGKNVGVYRARGEFVLSTNIDLLFSKELFDFIASDKIQKGVMYRCDRVDVEKDVPLNASLEEQLNYCKKHIIRICKKGGMWVPDLKPLNHRDEAPNPKPVNESRFHTIFSIGKKVLRNLLVKPHKAVYDFSYKLPFLLYLILFPLFFAISVLFIVPYNVIKMIWFIALRNRLSEYVLRTISFRVFLTRTNFKDNSWTRALKLAMVQDQTPKLHYNACGDFMLLDKESWFKFGSTPFYDGYSLHLDSLTMVNAYVHGVKFEELKSPLDIYHIEHGGGWTPESEARLYQAMNKREVNILTWPEYLLMAKALKEGEHAESRDWGYSKNNFKETIL